MRTTLSRALVALLVLAGLCGALSACGDDYEPMQYAMACMDGAGNRAPNEFCGSDMVHPRYGYSSAWGHIYDDGFYEPGYGRPLTGWSRQRPVNYSVRNTIINTAPSGGTLTRTGTGTASSGSSLASGKRIPSPPSSYSATSSGRKDSAPSGGGGSSTIQRGGLGPQAATGASKSSTSSSSSGSKSSGSSSSSKSGK